MSDEPNEIALEKQSALEKFFDLPAAPSAKPSTEVAKREMKPIPAAIASYDERDNTIEELYTNIHDTALDTHERIMDDIDDIDPKYGARNYEVAANYLTIALNAADRRAKLKEHKDKLVKQTTKVSTTNIMAKTISINTTDLIKQLSAEIIEGEIVSDTKPQEKINE
jgi:hypothetical protein